MTSFLHCVLTKVTGLFPSNVILLQLKLIIKLVEFIEGTFHAFVK